MYETLMTLSLYMHGTNDVSCIYYCIQVSCTVFRYLVLEEWRYCVKPVAFTQYKRMMNIYIFQTLLLSQDVSGEFGSLQERSMWMWTCVVHNVYKIHDIGFGNVHVRVADN
jgi:hypothetical protein